VLLLEQYAQRIDELTGRISRALQQRFHLDRLRLDNIKARLFAGNPQPLIRARLQILTEKRLRLSSSIRVIIATEQNRLAVLAARLQAISPLNTLQRGYAIVENQHGKLVRSSADIKEQEEIVTRLADGRFTAVVKKILID